MNLARWKQIDELFDAVLDQPETNREAFLNAKCAGDEELKNEILELLKAETDADRFLEKSAMGIAAQNLAGDQTIVDETPLVGKTIGTYEILSLLGSGGMGQVYLAQDTKLRRKVALKILPAEYVSSDERVKRFGLEARAISALNHPNIVTIFDVGTIDNINFIATEFVEGKTLRELINNKNLKLRETLNIISQTCEALSAAHERGIIHRDIKPENIIVRPDGYVKILDFGLAKLSDVDLHTMRNFAKTAKGVIIGTPGYMSPEQIADDKVDHRTDLWSVGVVLYEMLTGQNPFKKINRQATFQAILTETPPAASTLNPEIPFELEQLLAKALEKDPDVSYQTASDLRADLKRIRREIDSSPSISRSGASNTANRSSKFWVYLLAGGMMALIIFGFAIWFLVKNIWPNYGSNGVNWNNAQQIQLTQSPLFEGYPSLSPDAKNFIYAVENPNQSDIFLQRVGGKTPTNLTPDSKADDTMPVYSPNGNYIAFRSERASGGIYVMEATGENPRRVSEIGYHPSWSPDSSKLVVSEKSSDIHTNYTIGNSSLFVIDVASGTTSKLKIDGNAVMPNWSPNGHRIAFWFVSDGQLGEIATVPAEGGQPVIVAPDEASDWNPVWSPDGKFLYFASDRGGNMNRWRIAINEKTGQTTGPPESLPTPSKYLRHMSFSRDGKLMAYGRYESQSNLQSLNFDPQTLKITGEPFWITGGDREISHPALSPNDREFVLRIPTRVQEDIGIVNKDGSQQRNLTNDRFRDRQPQWSADGSKIFFQTDRSGKYQIWSINPDGTDARQITFSEKDSATGPIPSPDGNLLAFAEISGRLEKTYIIEPRKPWAEQTPQILAIADPDLSFVVRDWSPDGRQLLLAIFKSGMGSAELAVYDLESKTLKKLSLKGGSPKWLNDNRHFIYLSENTLFLFDTQTGKSSELYKPFQYSIQQPNISNDNKLIFYRYLQIDSDIWLMDASQTP